MKTLIAVLAVVAVIVIFGVAQYYSAYNYGADTETMLETRYKDMENILGQYSLKIVEMAQVPGMKMDDLAKITKEAMGGRYGEKGSQAVFQFIQERYPGAVTDTLYTQIQQAMEAGRNKFENAQRLFLEAKRPYVATLKKDLFLSRGFWLAVAGYPKINLNDMVIISSEHAQESFDTKVDKGLQLR